MARNMPIHITVSKCSFVGKCRYFFTFLGDGGFMFFSFSPRFFGEMIQFPPTGYTYLNWLPRIFDPSA